MQAAAYLSLRFPKRTESNPPKAMPAPIQESRGTGLLALGKSRWVIWFGRVVEFESGFFVASLPVAKQLKDNSSRAARIRQVLVIVF